jgi:hypothetical protein
MLRLLSGGQRCSLAIAALLLLSSVVLLTEMTTGADEFAIARPHVGPDGSNWVPPAEQSTALVVTPAGADELVECLLGPEVELVSVELFDGAGNPAAPEATATFTGGVPAFGFDEGLILSCGNAASVVAVGGQNSLPNTSTDLGRPGWPPLDDLIPGFQTNDATILKIEFRCEGIDVISFQYVFASEEYNEWVNTEFNDVFAFFLNGTTAAHNIALVPDDCGDLPGIPVSVNNVNCGDPGGDPTPTNPACYIDNACDNRCQVPPASVPHPCAVPQQDTEMDGQTLVFFATGMVDPAPATNTIWLAIADAGDHVLDSNVMIRCESFLCAPPIDVTLDIKPGLCPNPLNRKSQGKLPVALVGTELFDVAEVDISTLLIERADGIGGSVAPTEGPPGPHTVIEDVATPFEGEPCDCHELGGDGIDDLSMKFLTPELVAELELGDLAPGEFVELCVSGMLLDGTEFRECDCVWLVPPGMTPSTMTPGSPSGPES